MKKERQLIKTLSDLNTKIDRVSTKADTNEMKETLKGLQVEVKKIMSKVEGTSNGTV